MKEEFLEEESNKNSLYKENFSQRKIIWEVGVIMDKVESREEFKFLLSRDPPRC